jgi:hypothetical protein
MMSLRQGNRARNVGREVQAFPSSEDRLGPDSSRLDGPKMAPRFAYAGAERRGLVRTLALYLSSGPAHLQAKSGVPRRGAEADDGSRTRDLRLGKPTLYQLSYVRACGGPF